METVGVKELKNNLSRYLRKVKSGERIIFTDRKKEVALMAPLIKEPVEEEILRLVQSRAANWAGGKPAGLSKRIILRGKSVSDAVLQDRR